MAGLGRITHCPRYAQFTPRLHQKRSKHGQTKLQPHNIHEKILYSDARIVVYNKPSRKAVHSGRGVGKTILQQLEEVNISPIFSVHQLDRDTTGVLLMARDKEMAQYLSELIRHNKIIRSYLALCVGVPSKPRGEIGGLLGHYLRPASRGRPDMHVMGMTKRRTSNTQETVTKYRVLKTYTDALSMLELQPLTVGGKHQLKVHCAQLLRTPILGDGKYAPNALLHADLAQRFLRKGMGYTQLHLHSHRLLLPEYKHTNDLIVTAPLPNHFLDSIMKCEMYNFHRTRSVPKKDRLVDSVDEKYLQRLTGLEARDSFFEIDATIPEEEQELYEGLSYADEEIYNKSNANINERANVKLGNVLRRSLNKNSPR